MQIITEYFLVKCVHILKEKEIFFDIVAMDIKFLDVPHQKFIELKLPKNLKGHTFSSVSVLKD